ncbi:Spy0128 family protein [Enterococcus sp. DIV0755b]|uniref:Spy0128 family protein n=1 Tax=Enterococcus sp. DIV0755b TaxID=2774657 RepID=UPI003F685094
MAKKRCMSLFMIGVLLIQFLFPMNALAAGQDVCEKLNVTSKKILINDKEYESATEVKKGDKFQLEVYWNISDTTGIKAGDFIYIPVKISGVDIQTTMENSYSLKLEGSNTEIGRWGVIKEAEGQYLIKCTFNEEIESKASLKNGKFFAGGGITSNDTVVIEIADGSSPIEIPVTEGGGGNQIGIIRPSGNMEKWGWQNNNDVNRVNWEIGVNRSDFFDFLTGKITDIQAATKKNVLFIDELQKGQTVRSLSPWVAFPLVVEYQGQLQPGTPYAISGEFLGAQNFKKLEYQNGETESEFKEKVKNTPAPCYGIFPKDKHTAEANAPDDGDYLYFNAGDLPGTLRANFTKSDLYAAVDGLNVPEIVKETTRTAYDRYFSDLGVAANDYVPVMSPIIKFSTNVPEGTASQDIVNTARIEYSNSSVNSNESIVEYKDFNGTVGAVEKGNVRLEKRDAQTQEAIPGVSFGLYKKSGDQLTLLDNKQTNSEGIVEFEQIGIGNFVILELKSSTHDQKSLTIQNEQGQSVPVKDYNVDGLDYKGFEFSVTGDESAGLKYIGENQKKIATASFTVDKRLTGRNLLANEFQFELRDSEGKLLQTKTNDSDGNIYFDALSYEKAGTYDYTITEVKGSDATITYDKKVIKAKVTVSDESGQLVAKTAYEGNTTFENTYTPKSGSVVLTAQKKLNGRALNNGEFTFELRDSEGKLLQTKTNDSNGNIYFDALSYEKAGTYDYTITEVKGSDATITYDKKVIKAKVTVSDESGQLVAKTAYEGDTTFENTYTPKSGSIVLTAQKKLNGRTLKNGEFTFELRDSEGKLLQTKTNDSNGNVYFDALSYEKAGTYDYTITEVKGTDATITYDKKIVKAKVAVSDESGQLVAKTTYEGDTTFENTYTPKSGSVVLTAQKKLNGRALNNGEFTFELRDSEGKLLQTKTNDSNGNVYFDALSYEKAGTYDYTITEVKGTDATITYDKKVIKAKVTVSDESGQLVAKTTYEGDTTFENTYTPKTGSVVLTAQKKLNGRALNNGEFTFELRDSEGKLLQTKTNDSDGNIYFDALSYEKAGTYDYTITEVKGSDATITYDNTKYNAQVNVTDNNGKLTATSLYEKQPIFRNTYTPRKVINKENPQTKKYPRTGSSQSSWWIVTGGWILFGVISIFLYRFTKKQQ